MYVDFIKKSLKLESTENQAGEKREGDWNQLWSNSEFREKKKQKFLNPKPCSVDYKLSLSKKNEQKLYTLKQIFLVLDYYWGYIE